MKSAETLLISTLQDLPAYLKAHPLQDLAGDRLRAAGFDVMREVAAPYAGRRSERAGRIDLWVKLGEFEAAIEVDRGAPRRKSIAKLQTQRREVLRVIVVRDPKLTEVSVFGIDRIVLLGSRISSDP